MGEKRGSLGKRGHLLYLRTDENEDSRGGFLLLTSDNKTSSQKESRKSLQFLMIKRGDLASNYTDYVLGAQTVEGR